MDDRSGVGPNALLLPRGGGAATSITQGFQAELNRGTGTYSIRILAPRGRGGLQPDVRLSYSSAAGFGPAGLGWSVGPPRIERRTDTGAPTYVDQDDVFVFGGEELLHVSGVDYRCQVERQFWRITRNRDQWDVRDREGQRYLFGEAADERLSNPADPSEVLAWMLSRREDLNGNVIRYRYRRDQRVVAPAPGLSFSAGQVYPDRIEYNPHDGGWLHRIEFHYDFDDPSLPARGDAHLSYRPGFPLYTGWRLARVEVHADVPGEFAGLIRRYDLGYQDDPKTGLALLHTVTVSGFDGSGQSLALPPLTFGYARLDTAGAEVETLQGAPQIDFASGGIDLIDLTGNGLPDILSTAPGSHTFWLNNRWRPPASLPAGRRDFDLGTAMTTSPNVSLLQPSVRLADVRGRMAADLMDDTGVLDSPSYTATQTDILARNLGWGTGTAFTTPPPFNFSDGRARVVDLTGRNGMDVLRADGQFHHWLNHPDGQYEDRGMSPIIPGLSLTNPEWTFADLNGDGLTEIVRVRNGRIEYFLNRARGHRSGPLFESVPIVMGNSQALLQGATQWDPDRMLLIDLNGDGYDDAVYLYPDRVIYWINRGGWAWSDAHVVQLTERGNPILVTTSRASVRAGNILGTGMPGILWSGAAVPMRYLDFTQGQKPLLLTSVDNGVGGQTSIRYAPSTQPNGRAWTTRVPFTLHVVNQVVTTDTVTGNTETVNYRFLDGQFDRERREFLGFGTVEIEEVGDEGTADPVCETKITTIKSHLHSVGINAVERARQRALSGLPLSRAVSGPDTSRPYRVTEWRYEAVVPPSFDPPRPPSLLVPPSRGVYGTNGRSPRDAAGQPIPEPAATALLTHEVELVYDPVASSAATDRRAAAGGTLRMYSYRDAQGRLDPFGRRLHAVEAEDLTITATPGAGTEQLLSIDPTAPSLEESTAPGAVWVAAPGNRTRRTEFTYALQRREHLVNLLAQRVTLSEGQVVGELRRYYDGAAYHGLPLREVQRGNLSREETLVLRDDQYQAVYGGLTGQPPDLVALGYRRQAQRAPQTSRPIGPFNLLTRLTGRAATPRPVGGTTAGYLADTTRYRYLTRPDGTMAYGLIGGSLDPLGAETTFQPDPFYLQIASRTDPAGNTVTAALDYRTCEIARITDANGQVSQNDYDALGRVATVVKPGDSTAQPTLRYEYHLAGQALPVFVRTRQRENVGASDTFDSVTYVDGWGRRLQTRVEAEGGQYVVSGALGYNARGGTLYQVVPYRDPTSDYAAPPASAPRFSFSVDALDRETGIRDPDPGSVTRTSYRGMMIEESDREDSAAGSAHYGTATGYRMNSRGAVVEVHQRLSQVAIVAHYDYDVLGRLTAVSLTGGATRPALSYSYDLLSRRLRTDHVDAGTTRCVYDARGNLALRIDALGRVTEQLYDQAGRLRERRFPTTGEPPVVYRYCDSGGACTPHRNAIGRLEEVSDGGGTVRLSYDARGNLAQHERTWDEAGVQTSYAVDLAYDSADRLRRITYPALAPGAGRGAIEQRFNAGNLPAGLDLRRANTVTPLVDQVEYDPRGSRTQMTFGNGLVSEFRYHPTRFHLEGIRTFEPNAAVLQDLSYCHDLEGNLIVSVDAVNNLARVYSYDALYRLREAREVNTAPLAPLPQECGPLRAALEQAQATVWPYRYSDDGDVLELGDHGPVVYTAVTGRPHGRVEVGQFAYLFDPEGRLERVESVGPATPVIATMEYNAEGLLTRVELPVDDRVVTIVYDYEGERLRKRVSERNSGTVLSETRYLGRWVSFHQDGAAAGWQRIRQYVFDEKRRVAVLDAAGDPIEYLHPDLLGSAATITDGAGHLVATLRYEPFGTEQNPQAAANLRHRFNGKESDPETGLVNYGTRHYRPALGRWISPDPALWSEPEKLLRNPQALNAYAYALNNPATLVDPVGKSPGQYAGEYVDTRRTFVRTVPDAAGVQVRVAYRIVEAKPGTWLSKVTYDFGWGDKYAKKDGYGAYDRSIVYPLDRASPEQLSPSQLPFHPDRIQPGQQFAVRVPGEVPVESDVRPKERLLLWRLPEPTKPEPPPVPWLINVLSPGELTTSYVEYTLGSLQAEDSSASAQWTALGKIVVFGIVGWPFFLAGLEWALLGDMVAAGLMVEIPELGPEKGESSAGGGIHDKEP